MHSIFMRRAYFSTIIILTALFLTSCGEFDEPTPNQPVPFDNTPPGNTPPGNTPPGNIPPGSTLPTDPPVTDSPAQIVSAQYFIDGNDRFFTNLAHLFGRDLAGNPLNFTSNIRIRNNTSSPQTVFVKAVLQGYSEVAQRKVDLAPNETKDIPPINLTFDFEKLYSVTSAVNANMELSLYHGESLIDLTTYDISVQPVNRFQWFLYENGEYIDFRPFVSVLVTPDDRDNEIQNLLTEAAEYTQSRSIYGYQGGTIETALDQVFAVYFAMQVRNIVYTNVPGSFFDGAQYVKLPGQSLRTGSANCIDATLVFASALEAMGMEPLLVFMSGHALVGVRLMPGDDDSILLIETTLVGTADFATAVEQAHALVQARYQEGDELLEIFDHFDLRRRGVTPINL